MPDVMGDTVDWSRYNQPFGELSDPNPVAHRTPYGNIYKSDIDKGIDIGMGFSGGGLTTKPIRAYHSSPHDLEKFDYSKIGTGEGAQAFGHGFYFAESPVVSGRGGQYWGQFLRRFPEEEQSAASLLKGKGWDRDEALRYSQRNIDQLKNYPAELRAKGGRENLQSADYHEKLLERRLREHEMLASGQIIGPRTYEVDLHADPSQLLNWDKPVGDQPAYSALRRHWDNTLGDPDIVAERLGIAPTTYGSSLYGSLSGLSQNQRAATKTLFDAGVPGIKYLDEVSRSVKPFVVKHMSGDPAKSATFHSEADAATHLKNMLSAYPERAGEYSVVTQPRTSNYVMFDPERISIRRKYGIAGAAAPPAMGGLMAQDQYEVP